MKFLDEIGLASFWEKIKNWVNMNYLSLKGGSIRGNVAFHGDYSLIIEETDEYSQQYVKINYTNGISIGTHFDEGDETVDYVNINQSYISAPQFKKTNGKSTQALIADGSVREIGSANGIAGLDANGCVPLAQLGNLDTTVAEVVTALPTTNIKKHIYLIKDASGVTQNQYEEYIYTGDTSATYDASKWEKLGDFRATVDLADYAKKSETLSNLTWEQRGSGLFLSITIGNGNKVSEFMPTASSSKTGAMSNTDKAKLDGIEDGANNYTLPTASASVLGGILIGYGTSGRNYAVLLDGSGKAYVNVPWTDTNTTYDLSPYAKTADVNVALSKKVDVVSGKGLSTEDFTSALKTKLNGIANGATADSAIPTSVIDALN